jgi:hypothetical protein
MIFGVITMLDDGIEAAMGAHTANNIFLCIMVTNHHPLCRLRPSMNNIIFIPGLEFIGL